MQPSSLIFVVVVAIWAAYLVHHWVQRREHIATARSMDRFSEALRVLERRSVLAGPQPSPASAHSYAVSTASEGDGRHGASVSPSLRSPLRARTGSVAAAAAVAAVAAVPPSPRQSQGSRPAARVVVRRLRGLAFLVTLVAVPATVVLSALQVLLWVSVAISLAGFVLVLAWLRVSRVRSQAARRAGRTSHGQAKEGRVPAERHGIPDRRPGVGRDSDGVGRDSVGRDGATSGLQAAVGDSGLPVDDSVPDATSASAPANEAAGGGALPESAGEPPDEGAWSPVPVPPPTYTLKEAAPRGVPEPAAVTQVPVPIEVEDDDLECMAVDHLRRVVGV